MEKKSRLYGELFRSTFRLSAFTFGGGYVIVPLMRKRFVDQLHWIDEEEMLDLISVSQASPGPIAVNASLMLGYRMAGVPGALLTALGTVLPPLITLTVISFFYQLFRSNYFVNAVMKGMQAGVAAVICNVVLDMGRSVLAGRNWLAGLILAGVFVAVYFYKVNVFWVILICGAIGFLAGKIRRPKSGDGKGVSG